ncbi:unnamed protein product, partial [Prorocentrum cordatum]
VQPRHFERRHGRAAAEVEARVQDGLITPVKPRWGPKLCASRSVLSALLKDLLARGLGGLRTSIRARVALFFRAKEGGSQCVVVAAREATSALRDLDLSDAAFEAAGCNPRAADIHVASLDLCRGFYQCRARQLARRFGTEFAFAARERGVASCCDEGAAMELPVDGDAALYFVMEVLCRGLRWSLYFCQSIMGAPAPLVAPGHPAFSVHVDGGAVIGFHRDDAQRGLGRYLARLEEMDFVVHDVEPAQTELTLVGLCFLRGALLQLLLAEKYTWLLQQVGCPGVALQRVVGHLVHRFRLMPRGLSALGHCDRFLQRYGRREWGCFSDALDAELRVLKGLVKLVDVDLAAPRAIAVLWGQLDLRFKIEEANLADASGVGDRVAAHAPHLAAEFGSLGLGVAGIAEQAGPPRARPPSLPRRRRAPCRVVEASGAFHSLGDACTDPNRWLNIAKGGWAYHNATHMKEARVALMQLRRAARCSAIHGVRLLGLADNLSAAAIAIGAEIAWHLMRMQSARNCTDCDSRAADRGEVPLLHPLLFGGRAESGLPQRLGFCARKRPPSPAWLVAPPQPLPSSVWPAARGDGAAVSTASPRRRVSLCRRPGIYWTIENPLRSALWDHPLVRPLKLPQSVFVDLDMCEFGAHYRKPTGLLGAPPGLSQLHRCCQGGHYHDFLEGKIYAVPPSSPQTTAASAPRAAARPARAAWRTALAGAYLPGTCRAWAAISAGAAPRGARLGAAEGGNSVGRGQWHAALQPTAGLGAGPLGPRLDPPPADGVRECPLHGRALPADLAKLDEILKAFITELYFDGEAVSAGRAMLAAVAFSLNLGFGGKGAPQRLQEAQLAWRNAVRIEFMHSACARAPAAQGRMAVAARLAVRGGAMIAAGVEEWETYEFDAYEDVDFDSQGIPRPRDDDVDFPVSDWSAEQREEEYSRVGAFPNCSGVRSLACEIICVGPRQAEADFEGVCVRDFPVEKQRGMAGYTSFAQNCKDEAKGRLKEILCRSGGEALYGTLSHSHLAIILRAIDAGAKWEIPADDLTPAQVAMLQPMCEVGTGLPMMPAAAGNDPAAQKLVKEGMLYEVPGPDVMLGEQNCSIMAQAISRPQAFSMRMSELEAMKVFSSEIKNAKADGSDAITYESAMQAAGARLWSPPPDLPFCDFFNFILNLGADGGPHIRELIDIVETYVNSATGMSRLPAFGLVGEVSAQFPRAKVAVIARACRLPPKKASKQTGAPGWRIEPELAWKQRTLEPLLRLMEGVLHARHAALRTEIAKHLDNGASVVVQFLTNVNIQRASAMAVAVKGANPSTAKAREALLQGRKAAYANALPTEKAAALMATFQAQEDWNWFDFATLPPEEMTTAQEKGGGPAAQPAAIASSAITGRPENEQATVKKGERPAMWFLLPVTEWLAQAAARDMGKRVAYMGAVLQVLREKHLVHVEVWAKNPEEPVKTSFYMHPEFAAPGSKTPYDVEETDPAQREWKWAGKDSMHPFWSATKLTAEELGARSVAEAGAGRARFNVELAPKEVNIAICGRAICVRIPVATNAVDLQAGEELIMEYTHVKRKKEAAPTDRWKAAKKDGGLESDAARCRRSVSVPAQTLAPFGSACAAGDAAASMGKSKTARASPQWEPAQLGERFSVWGGRLTEPRALLETEEISTIAGRVKFVDFSVGLPWVVHALGYALRNSNGASVQGRAWKDIADAFKAQARAEGAAAAAGEDDKGETPWTP